jgi:hypothetical protein
MMADLRQAAEPSLLVTLVLLVDHLPLPNPPPRCRGRPATYPDRLFLKALVVMSVRHLSKVGTLLAVLEEPTPEIRRLRALLTEEGRFPSRRTWERRLRAIPDTLPAQIACLGRHRVAMLDLRGASPSAIASQLGADFRTVRRDLSLIAKERAHATDLDGERHRLLATARTVEVKAWNVYETATDTNGRLGALAKVLAAQQRAADVVAALATLDLERRLQALEERLELGRAA